ncbi:Cytochrome P450 monooxygenase orf2 [Drechslerella dactyloides]|uniref:Cytochrome P450 monooxygenase orf2 n=1 Tax=Drechslerella dactyloides TaxID=74499 RepID=A0AAD6NML8_DREDA|nr:Cytochrome P450 monooxygenase orf2 [Drechslerella dactyloides]
MEVLSLKYWPILVVGCPIAYLVFGSIYQLYFSPLAKVPGPWYTAVSRYWLARVSLQGRRIFAVHDLHLKYGPYVRIAPNEVSVSEIEAVKQIHSSHNNFSKPTWYADVANGVKSAFAIVDPEDHKARRKAYGTVYSNTNMSLLEPVIRKHITVCVSKIKRDLNRGPVDILRWFRFMAADIVAELCYGKDMDMLNKEAVNPIVEDLTILLTIGGVRAEIPGLNVLESLISLIPHPTVRFITGCSKRIFEYSDDVLSEFQEKIRHDRDNNLAPFLFTRLINNMNNPTEKYRLNFDEIRHESTANLIAGSDTISTTGTYIIWAILKHSDVRSKLEDELKTLGDDLTDARLQQLPYLKLVTKETLRLYGAGPGGMPRIVPPGGWRLGPYYFSAGTGVSSQGYTQHREAAVFEDPYAFKPERWLNPTKEMEAHMVPWGGASRTCPGQNLAMIELRLIAATFLKECPDAVLAESCTDQSMEFINYFNIKPSGNRANYQKPGYWAGW